MASVVAQRDASATFGGNAYASLIASIAVVLRAYPRLPKRIPLHFSFGGKPGSYGPTFVLLATPAILLVVMPFMETASTHPAHGLAVNGPHLVYLIFTEIGALLTLVNLSIVAVALGGACGSRSPRCSSASAIATTAVISELTK